MVHLVPDDDGRQAPRCGPCVQRYSARQKDYSVLFDVEGTGIQAELVTGDLP